MKLRHYLLPLLVAIPLVVTAVARAQVETTPIPMTPKPNFASMQHLVGTWNCSETNTRRSTAYTSTFTTTMDPSGYWMNTKTVNHPTAWQKTENVATDKVTYDSANKRWVDVGIDDQGNYGLSMSNGWSGNQIVWRPVSFTSVGSGNVVSGGPTTVTKAGDTKYTYAGSFKESGGRTITLKGTCTKQ